MAKKKSVRKKTTSSKTVKDSKIENVLVENFVSLQKVMTDLASKFDSLSKQLTKLLGLFEISAKTLSEKGYATEEDKKIIVKLDNLLEHNKVIAKGIALLHEKEKEPEKPENLGIENLGEKKEQKTPQLSNEGWNPSPKIPEQIKTYSMPKDVEKEFNQIDFSKMKNLPK